MGTELRGPVGGLHLVKPRLWTGIRGSWGAREALLDAPLSIQPYGILRGGAEGFGGELGVGIRLAPTFMLRIVPFVEARIAELAAVYDFPALEMDMGELFSFEWGTKYLFGDVEGQEEGTTSEQSTPAPAQSETKHTEAPQMPVSTGAGGNVPGGPQLDSGEEVANKQAAAGGGGDAGGMGEMMEKVDQISTLAEGIGALADLMKIIINAIMAAATFGPIGLMVYLVFEAVFGDLSWDSISQKVDAIVKAYEEGKEMLEPFLPEWLTDVIDIFTGERPSLLDALFGADDAMREAVARGEHEYAPAEMRAKMCEEMLKGYTGEADQDAIIEVLRFSSSKGDLSSVVSMAGGADWFISDLDGWQDDECRRLFDRAGNLLRQRGGGRRGQRIPRNLWSAPRSIRRRCGGEVH